MESKTLHHSDEEYEWAPPRFLSLTSLLMLTCILILGFSEWVKKDGQPFSLVQSSLFFDYPQAFSLVELAASSATVEAQDAFLAIYQQMPHWEGILKLTDGQQFSSIPFMEKIKVGEVWRLITPILLHADWQHLVLNLSWLLFLGAMMEERMGKGRLILFILITGIICNLTQYIVTGPIFCGFSGVLRGMIAYIWVRKTFAPFENYPISQLTINLSIGYVIAMFGFEVVGGYIDFYPFGPDIANSSHLAGVFVGSLLGLSQTDRFKF